MAANHFISGASAPFGGKTTSMDIPKPRVSGYLAGRDSFAAVVARSLPAQQPNLLPTPPNSISPSLPPQVFGTQRGVRGSTPPASLAIDSDIDLQDAVEHANSQDQPQQGLLSAGLNGSNQDFDTAGAITPGLLAKHHLPDILLSHGPLAIRHIMGYLTTSVPGFSGIPPAKARRLVVAALEGRGQGGEIGRLNVDVEFAKVGWGRWEAKRKGSGPKQDDEQPSALSPPRSLSSSYSSGPTDVLQIPSSGRFGTRSRGVDFGTSWAADSIAFSHDEGLEQEDYTMLEHEADKMSLDGDASCSSSEVPDEGPVLDEDLGDITDEEDWAQIGAAALRQGSLSASGGRNTYLSAHLSTSVRGGGPSPLALASSVPAFYNSLPSFERFDFPRDGGQGGFSETEEREAIEALVRLSSV